MTPSDSVTSPCGKGGVGKYQILPVSSFSSVYSMRLAMNLNLPVSTFRRFGRLRKLDILIHWAV